jgi:hypothetical protein
MRQLQERLHRSYRQTRQILAEQRIPVLALFATGNYRIAESDLLKLEQKLCVKAKV